MCTFCFFNPTNKKGPPLHLNAKKIDIQSTKLLFQIFFHELMFVFEYFVEIGSFTNKVTKQSIQKTVYPKTWKA